MPIGCSALLRRRVLARLDELFPWRVRDEGSTKVQLQMRPECDVLRLQCGCQHREWLPLFAV
eukprot:1593875-Prymnesium_polylepis.1